jgi:MoaA/NifB/PqqE/SkfB family radical SAM enzyme
MWAATELLLSIGFAAAHPTRLGLETVIVPRNLVHIPELWRFCRERNIFPYFEFVKMQGRAEHHEPDLRVPPAEARDLFEWLRDIDRADYGLDWPMLPPIAAYRCTQIYCGCYVTGRGSMQPCPGIPFGVGRIMLQNGRTNLEDLLRRDPFPALRQIRYKVSGPCQSCQVDPERLCYGCRACAYLGDGVSASDPTCWNVAPAARTGA